MIQSKKYLSDPDMSVVIETWNGVENILPMKVWCSLNNPIIEYNKIFYFPKRYKEISLEQVNEWANNNSLYKQEQLIKNSRNFSTFGNIQNYKQFDIEKKQENTV